MGRTIQKYAKTVSMAERLEQKVDEREKNQRKEADDDKEIENKSAENEG